MDINLKTGLVMVVLTVLSSTTTNLLLNVQTGNTFT